MEKMKYIAPDLNQIIIDNEITLQLESQAAPPFGPGESKAGMPDFLLNQSPFNDTVA